MNETIRDFLKRRVRWCMAIAVGGWLLFPIVGLTSPGEIQPAIAGLGVLMFGAGALAMHWIVRCPRCSVRLGHIAMTLGIPGLKPKPNFCPYCGVSMDEPRVKQSAPGQPVPFNPIR